ncbi:MAG TPA: DUF2892 domain-containing protein [Paludibacter sp.]|nr:DUF2892 domain-containing protein [Paludibacter sp.]
MKANVGFIDRIIRVILALVFVGLYVAGVLPGTIGFVMLGVAGILILTALVGICPLYWVLGISTLKKL